MAPFKSSLARSAAKLLGISNQRDLSLRGNVQSTRKLGNLASGGTKTYSGGYTIHTFTSTGSLVVASTESGSKRYSLYNSAKNAVCAVFKKE